MFSETVAVVQYAKLPRATYDQKFSSYKSVYVHCISKNGLSERDCDAHVEAYLTISIFDASLKQDVDISDSRAAIQYLERQHTTCSFRVTSVSTHKMVSRKLVAFLV